MSSSLQKYLSEWMTTDAEDKEGGDEYDNDPLLELDAGLGVCGRNNSTAQQKQHQQHHPSLPPASSSATSVDAVHGKRDDRKNKNGSSNNSSSKPKPHHQTALPETPLARQNHSQQQQQQQRQQQQDFNTGATTMKNLNTPTTNLLSTATENSTAVVLSPFSSVFRRRALPISKTTTTTDTNTKAATITDPLQNPDWRDNLSLDQSRVVSVVVYVTNPPPSSSSSQQHQQQQQQQSLGRSASGRKKKSSTSDNDVQHQHIPCVFPFDRFHKVPRSPPPNSNSANAADGTASPTLACFQGIFTTRDLVIVNPTAFGERLPNDVNMEIIRQVAFASAKNSNNDTNGNGYTTEDWARIFRFNQVLWPDHNDSNINAASDTLSGGGGLTTMTNDGTTRGLDNLVQAAVNDMIRPASISTRTFVAVSQSGLHAAANNNNNNMTSSSNNSTTNMSSAASVMSATTVSSVSSKSLLLSSSNPHQVKTLHIFGSIILKSVVQSFATSSLLQQHHSTADILSTYGMLGLTVHKVLSSAASATHTVMLSLLEITPEDTIHDLLWLRSRTLLASPPPASAAGASGASQSHASSSPTRGGSGKSNNNTTPQRPAKMQDSNRVNLRYSGSSSSHTSAPGGGPTLEGLEQIPIDSLKSMGHAVRRAFIMSRHLPSNAKGKRRGHVVAMIRLLPINNNNNNNSNSNSGATGSSLLLDNSTCKPPIIQFVDVAVPSTSSSSFGKPQPTTTSSSHNTSQSNGSIRRDASIRKATSALHGVLRGLLLRGAGNNVILPFRDSLLTKVVQRSVDRPDVRVCVLTGVSTLTVDYEDSMASLRFASRLLERPGEMPKSPFDTLSRTTTTCSPESSQTSSDEDDFDESSSSGEDGDNGHRDGRRRRGLHLSHWDPPLHETIVRNITSDPRQRFSKAGVTGTTKRRKQRRPYQHQQQFLESSDSREVEISQSNSPYHVFEVQHELPAPIETATMTMTTTTTTTSTREEMERRLQRLQQVAGRSRFSSSSSRPVLPTTMAQQAENDFPEGTAGHNVDLQMGRNAQRQQEHADGGTDATAAVSARGQTDATRDPPVLTIPVTHDFLSQSQSALETPVARNSGFRSGLQDHNGRHEQDAINYAQTYLHLQQPQEQDDTSDAVDVDWSSPSRPTIDTRFGDNHHGETNEYFLDDEPSPLTADTFGMSSALADRFGAATGASSPPSTHQFHNRDEDDGGFIPLNPHHDNGRSDMVESVNEEIELYDSEREYIMDSSRERQQDRRPFGHVQTTSTITEEEEGVVTALQQQGTVSTTATERFSDSAEAATAPDEHVATDVENYRSAHQINNDMITHTVRPEAAMFSSVTGLGQRLHHVSLQSGQDEKDDDEDDGNVDPKLLDDLSYELKLRAEFATTDVGEDYNDEYPLPTKEAMDDLSIELFSKPRDGSYQDTHDLYSDFTPAARETHDARIVSKADSTAAVASTNLADDGSSRISLSKEDVASTTSSVDRLRKLSWQRREEEQGGSASAARDEPVGSWTNTNTRRRLSGIQPPSASPYRRAHGRDRDSLGRDAVSSTTQDDRMSAMLSPIQQPQERHENTEFVPRSDYDRSEDEHADDSRLRSKYPLHDGSSRSSPRLKDPPARSAQTDTITHLESQRHEIEPHEDAQQPAPRHHPGSFDNNSPYLTVLNRATSGSSTESFNLRSTSSREQAPNNTWNDGASHGDSSRNTEHEIQDLTAAIVRVKAQNQQSSMSINQEIQHIERSQDTVIRKLTAERDMAKREIDRRTELQRQETMRLEEELREVRRQLENSNAQAAEFEQLAEAAVEGREGLESTVRDLRAALSDSVGVDEYHELQEEKEQLAQSLHEAKKQAIERNSQLNDTELALKEFETEIQSLQKEKNHLLERLSTLTESTEHLQGELYQLQTERSALRARVDRTTKDGAALEVQLAESEGNLRNARHEKQQLDKQVRDDFESFTKSITQYREKQKEMLREKADHQAVLASAQTKLGDALAELDQLRASADKERNKLQGELDNFVSNLQIVTGELKIVVAQRDEGRSELERISGILNAAMAERDEALSELDATNSAKENAEQRVSVLKDECRDMQATIGRRIQILQEGRNRDIEELHNLQRIVEEQTVNIERLKEDRRRAQEELHDVQQTNERLNRAFQKARQERDDARESLQLRQQEQPHPEVFGRTSGGFRNVRSTNDNAHIDRIAHHHDGSRISGGEFEQMARHSSNRSSPRNKGDNSSIVLRQETPMTRNENNGNPHEIIRQYEEIMARVRDALREHRNTGSAGDENIWTRLHSLEQMVHAHCLSTGSRMHVIEQQQQQQQQDQHRQQRRLAGSRPIM